MPQNQPHVQVKSKLARLQSCQKWQKTGKGGGKGGGRGEAKTLRKESFTVIDSRLGQFDVKCPSKSLFWSATELTSGKEKKKSVHVKTPLKTKFYRSFVRSFVCLFHSTILDSVRNLTPAKRPKLPKALPSPYLFFFSNTDIAAIYFYMQLLFSWLIAFVDLPVSPRRLTFTWRLCLFLFLWPFQLYFIP